MVAPKRCDELLATFVHHKVYRRAQCVSDWISSANREARDAGAASTGVLTKMKIESSVQPKHPPMLHNRSHGLKCPLVLITGRDRLSPRVDRLFLARQQDRDLGAQLRQLKGAGEDRDKRARRRPRGCETRARVEIGVVSLCTRVGDDVDAETPVDPLRVFDLGAAVKGERYGPDKSYASHRRSDA